MAKSKYYPEVNLKRCKGCGLCVAFCPQNVFESAFDGKALVKNKENCIGCMTCDLRCPDYAIQMIVVGE